MTFKTNSNKIVVCGYKDTQNLDERNDLHEKLVEKVFFFNN